MLPGGAALKFIYLILLRGHRYSGSNILSQLQGQACAWMKPIVVYDDMQQAVHEGQFTELDTNAISTTSLLDTNVTSTASLSS